MHDPEEELRNYSRRIGPSRQENPEVLELAYQLQNASPNDRDLIERLVFRYAGDLYKWVGILLYFRKMAVPCHEEILSVLIRVFETALKEVDQFHGIERISSWLFGIGYQSVRQYREKNRSKNFLRERIHPDQQADIPSKPVSPYWYSVDRLPEKIRTPLILRYLFDLEIPEIAIILNIQAKDVHRRLVIGRKQLIVNPTEPHMDRQIQSYVDGLLNDQPSEIIRLLGHLETCDQCRKWVLKIDGLEKTLSESIRIRWVFTILRDKELSSLVQSIIDEISHPKIGWKIQFQFRQTAWILGLALTVMGMSFVLLRFTSFDAGLQPPGVTPTQRLPPVVEIKPANTTSQTNNDNQTTPQYIEPAFSSDGKWAVFTSLKSIPSTWGQTLPTIELYNREANTIQVISEATAPSDKLWIWWDMTPSISGDGRWIVYVSATNDPKNKGNPCETPDHNACMDVFLFDRETGLTRRLTQAINGEPADGDSLAPTISEDGQWVTFWSAADNLVDGFTNQCKTSQTGATCLYIYIYSLATGNTEWIPIPTAPGDPVFGVDRISLSSDGRYVGFTVTPAANAETSSSGIFQTPVNQVNSTDGTGSNISIPVIMHSSEAIVYDRETGNYELENQAQDGTPGDGVSSSPVLSGDGRYVAFTSASTNIVPGDTNKYSDVFLRDRVTGKVELISVNSIGSNSRINSGLTLWGRGYYSINISKDGRYVVFESTTTNWGQDISPGCNSIDTSNCNYLFVYDRQTGSTDWITALPNFDFTLFPEISSDGRWISFMETFQNCSSMQIACSNVMLYDRQRRWMTNLTKYTQESPYLQWTYDGSLALPWGTGGSTAFAFSPDGNFIAIGGADLMVRVWQISDGNLNNKGEPVAILESGGTDRFSALTFSPNGEWLVAGTTSGFVYVWRIPDGKLLYSLKDQSGLIRKLVFSQDSPYLVISTIDESWIYRTSNNQLSKVNSIPYGIKVAFAIDIAPKGNMLATSRGDGSVFIQTLPSGRVIGRLDSNQLDVSSLVFSDDGSLLATRSIDETIDIWRIEAGDSITPSITLINTFQSYGYVGPFVISPDNKYLASAGMDGGFTFWSIPDGKIFTVSTPVPNGMVFSLAFSQQGDKLAAVFENKISLWGIPTNNASTFYVHSIEDTYVDVKPIPEPSASDIPVFQSPDNGVIADNLTLDQAASSGISPLIIPSHIPENINFASASVNNDGSILLRYDAYNPELYQASLYIYEKYIGDAVPPKMIVGAGADVILTQVETLTGGALAEYVQGDWLWRQSYTPPTGDATSGEAHIVWDWDNTSKSQRLRWQQNGLLIGLYYQAYRLYTPLLRSPFENDKISYVSSILDQGDLEQIASHMIPFSDTSIGTTSERPSP